MCVHRLGRIRALDWHDSRATVEIEGALMDVSLLVLDDEPKVGAWVVVHHGFAVQVVDDDTAAAIRSTRVATGLTGSGSSVNERDRHGGTP